jgi:hypothetical protein
MKLIVKPFAVHKIGNWVRLCDYGKSAREYGRYIVECSPMCTDNHKPTKDEWSGFGGTVGYGTAQFRHKDQGIRFVKNILRLSSWEMKRIWEPKIGALPLWDGYYGRW